MHAKKQSVHRHVLIEMQLVNLTKIQYTHDKSFLLTKYSNIFFTNEVKKHNKIGTLNLLLIRAYLKAGLWLLRAFMQMLFKGLFKISVVVVSTFVLFLNRYYRFIHALCSCFAFTDFLVGMRLVYKIVKKQHIV